MRPIPVVNQEPTLFDASELFEALRGRFAASKTTTAVLTAIRST